MRFNSLTMATSPTRPRREHCPGLKHHRPAGAQLPDADGKLRGTLDGEGYWSNKT
jgi:hypothetical protein